jgi:hypothetical protein
MYDESAKSPGTIKKGATVNRRQTERVNEAFFDPWIRDLRWKKIRIRDEHPESYFQMFFEKK